MEHSPRAHRGQHFLRRRSAKALVEAARITSGDLVVEIGAGTGVITDLLVERARAVVGIESDPGLSKELIKRFAEEEGVHIVAGDALTFPYPRDPHRVLGNIPFNITTSLLRLLLDDPGSSLTRADLIVEMGAAIKRTSRGRALNVGWGPWWTLRRTTRIPRAEFTPPPPRDAAILLVERRVKPLLPVGEAGAFREFVEQGFRKSPNAKDLALAEWIRRFRGGRPHR